MEPIRIIESRTAVLPSTNIDTDQIIPARFLTTTTKEGLGKLAFFDWRYDASGAPKPEFALNRPEAAGCTILVGGRNFGCGSSREHAPWALSEYGFRVIIAPSFADIFANNCFKNGMLPITLDEEQVRGIMRRAQQQEGYTLTVDLERLTIEDPGRLSIPFVVGEFQRYCLLEGLDDIGLTLRHEDLIADYEARHANPW